VAALAFFLLDFVSVSVIDYEDRLESLPGCLEMNWNCGARIVPYPNASRPSQTQQQHVDFNQPAGCEKA
jgi:hypothetical protein